MTEPYFEKRAWTSCMLLCPQKHESHMFLLLCSLPQILTLLWICVLTSSWGCHISLLALHSNVKLFENELNDCGATILYRIRYFGQAKLKGVVLCNSESVSGCFISVLWEGVLKLSFKYIWNCEQCVVIQSIKTRGKRLILVLTDISPNWYMLCLTLFCMFPHVYTLSKKILIQFCISPMWRSEKIDNWKYRQVIWNSPHAFSVLLE